MLTSARAQVTIIGPSTNNGGFEDATASPWQISNGTQTNKWIVGTGATAGFTGTRSAYISNGTGTAAAHAYTFTSGTSVFLYQDVTLPAGYPDLTLTFRAIQKGQNNFDQGIVYMSTGTPGAAPVAGTSTTSIAAMPPLPGHQRLFVVPVQTTAGWTTYSVTIPASLAGNTTTATTRRLMFQWVNNASTGTNPPIGIDDITLTATCSAPQVPYPTVRYCQFDAATPLQAYGNNLKFYTTPTGGTGLPSRTPGTNAPGTTIYYVSQTNGGCESPRTPITVVVTAKPVPPSVVSPINVCQFSVPLPLSAMGQNLTWYEVPTGGVAYPNPPSPPTGYAGTFTYYVTQTVNGCESNRTPIQVNVNYQPNATFVPSKNYVCVDDTISFIYFGNALPNATYNWIILTPNGYPVSGMGTQGPLVARFNTPGTYEVRLVVENNGCISAPVFQSFEVRQRPYVRLAGKREICIEEVTELTLDNISDSISSYSWNFGDGTVVYSTQSTGPFGVKWSTPGVKDILVKTVSRQCGSYDYIENVKVRPAPVAVILNKPTASVCSGDSIRLQAADLGPGYSYKWTPAALFHNEEQVGTSVWAVAGSGTTTYVDLTVTDTFGCKGQDFLQLSTESCCKVWFPNAFTPNNDAKNDVFGMITNGTPQIASFRIFNRVGNMVFETSNPRQGWDGTFMSQPQPTGVYYYYVRYRCDGKDFEQKGEVTLLR